MTNLDRLLELRAKQSSRIFALTKDEGQEYTLLYEKLKQAEESIKDKQKCTYCLQYMDTGFFSSNCGCCFCDRIRGLEQSQKTNQEIVERIRKSIKHIEDLKEKDTINNSHLAIYTHDLPYLKSLLEKQVN